MWTFDEMMKRFENSDQSRLLIQGTWGLEKESHRVNTVGELAMTEHPLAFGNKRTNSRITTDFAESQLELITPPLPSIREVHESLNQLHDEVDQDLGDELLWPFSMPPRLPPEEQIPLARFDETPEGRASELYRRSLVARYGAKMQMISGLHVNFSFSDELLTFVADTAGLTGSKQEQRNEIYSAVARNFLRYRWLLIYLFGASPCADDSYSSVLTKELDVIERCCPACCSVTEDWRQYATSLRVSRYGYSNSSQRASNVSFDSLTAYIADMQRLLGTRSEQYYKLGIYKDGKQIQLNGNVLQKESELYSSIRLKQAAQQGETQLQALERGGVGYLEVRILDLNPDERVGISLQQLHAVHVFMLYCLFEASPPISVDEWSATQENHHLVSLFGRRPGLVLTRYGYGRGRVAMQKWMREIFSKLKEIAGMLDRAAGASIYSRVIEEEARKVGNLDLLPSSRIQAELLAGRESFLELGVRKAMKHQVKGGCIHAV